MEPYSILYNYYKKNYTPDYQTIFTKPYIDRNVFALLLIKEATEKDLLFIWKTYDENNANIWYCYYHYQLNQNFTAKPQFNKPQLNKMIYIQSLFRDEVPENGGELEREFVLKNPSKHPRLISKEEYESIKNEKNYSRLKEVLPEDLPEEIDLLTLLSLRSLNFSFSDYSIERLYYGINPNLRFYILDFLIDIYGNDQKTWEFLVLQNIPDAIIAALIPPEFAYLAIVSQKRANDFDALAILNYQQWLLTGNSFYKSFIVERIDLKYSSYHLEPTANLIKQNVINVPAFLPKIIQFVQNRLSVNGIASAQSMEKVNEITSAIQYFDLVEPVDCNDIKKAYRRRSLKDHPDKGGTEALFIKTSKTYDLLKEKYKC